MSTLTDKLPTLPSFPTIKVESVSLDEAKKPLFAAVGVVDLYVEQAKALPAEAKKLQAKVTEKATAARSLRAEQVKGLPAQVKGLPAKTTEKANELRTELQGRVTKAQTYYGTLAARGEKLVAQIRNQETTTAAIAEGKAAVKKATAAATGARKTAAKAEKAVEDAVENVG